MPHPSPHAELCEAVTEYVGTTPSDLPLAQLRRDLEEIIDDHGAVGSVTTTPRGNDGGCDIQVHGRDGKPLALVTLYCDGTVLALPVVRAEIVEPAAILRDAISAERIEAIDEASRDDVAVLALAARDEIAALHGVIADALGQIHELNVEQRTA